MEPPNVLLMLLRKEHLEGLLDFKIWNEQKLPLQTILSRHRNCPVQSPSFRKKYMLSENLTNQRCSVHIYPDCLLCLQNTGLAYKDYLIIIMT